MRLDIGMKAGAMATLGRTLIAKAEESDGQDGRAEVEIYGTDNDDGTEVTLRFSNEDMERPEMTDVFVVEIDQE